MESAAWCGGGCAEDVGDMSSPCNGLHVDALQFLSQRKEHYCYDAYDILKHRADLVVWQFIFSDHTYDKPFFLVYVNTSVFALALLPRFVVYITKNGLRGLRSDVSAMWMEHKQQGMSIAKAPLDSNRESQEFSPVSGNDDDDDIGRETTTGERLLIDEEIGGLTSFNDVEEKLNLRETALLSLEFCMLWFFANYFASACLEYTSVASTTILTSTSSVWTLVFCAILRVEPFSLRKLVGVMASLVGIVLTSTIDLTGGADEDRGSFPHKTPSQIAIGDSMAFLSAVVYGMYVTVMKKRVGNEDRVDMQLFFGLVGVINLLCLWPLFFILHWTDIEPVCHIIESLDALPLQLANSSDSLKCRRQVRYG